jgi:hypothetical protein
MGTDFKGKDGFQFRKPYSGQRGWVGEGGTREAKQGAYGSEVTCGNESPFPRTSVIVNGKQAASVLKKASENEGCCPEELTYEPPASLHLSPGLVKKNPEKFPQLPK